MVSCWIYDYHVIYSIMNYGSNFDIHYAAKPANVCFDLTAKRAPWISHAARLIFQFTSLGCGSVTRSKPSVTLATNPKRALLASGTRLFS